MKHLTHTLSSLALLSLIFTGCTTTTVQANNSDIQKNTVSTFEQIPAWVNNPGHGNSIGIGSSNIGKKSLSFQRKTAVHNAQVEMARNIKSDVAEIMKNYQSITGESGSSTFDNFIASYSDGVISEGLSNTQVDKSFKDKDGTLYVLLVPSTYILAKSDVVSLSANSRDNLDAKWAKFQAEDMQKELQARVDNKKIQ